jgi:hypothetical protein
MQPVSSPGSLRFWLEFATLFALTKFAFLQSGDACHRDADGHYWIRGQRFSPASPSGVFSVRPHAVV